MAITAANAASFVRSIVGESTAKYWTDAEITLYLQFAMEKVQAEMLPFLWDRYKTYADLATTAGTSLYNPPTDSYKISHIQVKETGKKLKYIDEGEMYKYRYANGGCDITDTDYFVVWYVKNLDEITDFPGSCRVLIAVEAALMARGKNEDVTPDLLMMRKEASDAARMDLAMTNVGDVSAFPDYLEENAMEPGYAWTWKNGQIEILSLG